MREVLVAALVVAAVLVLARVVDVRGYENLVFSAGGARGAAHAGVLAFMHERGLMRAHRFAGSSVGAVIAAACAMRMDARAIARVWSEVDLRALVRPGAMHAFFRRVIARETGSSETTFRELHRAKGTTLVVAATCVSLTRCVYFTHTDPELADTPVALALLMSCSVPYAFPPVSYKGLLFADGGLTDSLPLASFNPHTTLGVRLLSSAEPSGARPYAELLVSSAMSRRRGVEPWVMHVETTRAPAEELVRQGYAAAARFFGL
jgi:predicted acylesterase/phospholipase RssA